MIWVGRFLLLTIRGLSHACMHELGDEKIDDDDDDDDDDAMLTD